MPHHERPTAAQPMARPVLDGGQVCAVLRSPWLAILNAQDIGCGLLGCTILGCRLQCSLWSGGRGCLQQLPGLCRGSRAGNCVDCMLGDRLAGGSHLRGGRTCVHSEQCCQRLETSVLDDRIQGRLQRRVPPTSMAA